MVIFGFGFTQVKSKDAVQSPRGYSKLSAPQSFTFAEFSESESTDLGFQEFEDISAESLLISLPARNSVTLLFIYIFMANFDDRHLLTIRFRE